jgi:hypothetical protein
LTWRLHFPNKIGSAWEAAGNGEAHVFFHSIANVAGYNSTPCLSLHIAAAAQHRFTSFFQKFQTKGNLKRGTVSPKREYIFTNRNLYSGFNPLDSESSETSF